VAEGKALEATAKQIKKMETEITNKVANSGIVSIDLAEYLPISEVLFIDIKNHLFQEIILKEKDFREFIKANDWSVYQDKYVGIYCSVDAIIPTWAYMLLASALSNIAKALYFGQPKDVYAEIVSVNFLKQDLSDFEGKRLVIKGCGDIAIGEQAFLTVTNALKPIAKALMYGEPCSTVPIYKKRRD
jgi:Protein of unknown function (DUF2480)